MRSSTKSKKSGQVTAEYAVLLTIVFWLMFESGVIENLKLGIDSYFSDIVTVINLPIP